MAVVPWPKPFPTWQVYFWLIIAKYSPIMKTRAGIVNKEMDVKSWPSAQEGASYFGFGIRRYGKILPRGYCSRVYGDNTFSTLGLKYDIK